MSQKSGSRLDSIDVARGLAVLLMIQTHAYDGWVLPSERASAGFRLTRVLGTLPLPMFLLLAGLGLSLRIEAARQRGQDHGALRKDVVKSALEIVATGYALSFAYAWMDGARGLETLLRADVLHAIGLSLALMALCAVGKSLGASRVMGAAWLLTIVPVLVCPALTRLGAELSGPMRFFWALWIDVPSVTRMPVVPLLSFCATGCLLGQWLVRARERPARTFAFSVGGLGATLLCLGLLGAALSEKLGMPMSRAQPSIAFNVLDLDGRALLAIGLGLGLTPVLGWTRSGLVACGRHSLFVYALHLPFCYGAIARPLKRSLSMATASVYVLGLCAACAAAALALAHWHRTRAKRLS